MLAKSCGDLAKTLLIAIFKKQREKISSPIKTGGQVVAT